MCCYEFLMAWDVRDGLRVGRARVDRQVRKYLCNTLGFWPHFQP